MKKNLLAVLQQIPQVTRFVVVGLVVLFISSLFPNDIQFKYSFKEGATWNYGTLKAPFSFAIKKSEEERLADLKAVSAQIPPCYVLDRGTGIRQLQQFNTRFNEKLAEAKQDSIYWDVQERTNKYLQVGRIALQTVYQKGVIELDGRHDNENNNFIIGIVKGNTIERRTIGTLYNVKKAINYINDSILLMSRLQEADFFIPIVEQTISANIAYSDSLSNKFIQDALAELPTHKGMVNEGETIIRNNSIVTKAAYQRLSSFKEKYEEEVVKDRNTRWIQVGCFILTLLIIGAFLLFLRLYALEVYTSLRELLFMFLWIVVYSYLVYFVDKTQFLNVYLIPFCIIPIVIKNFYNARIALFTHIVVILIASFLSSLGYEFTFVQILAGIITVLASVGVRNWSRFFLSMLLIFVTYSVSFIALELMSEGVIAHIEWVTLGWIALNIFLTLLAYPLIPLLERIFGFTSEITLVELADLDKPLLKELSVKAPGTLQHSLQVANLSEAAANAIGADTLKVKVAALYHDVGKMISPQHFIENQNGYNPHEEMTPLESVQMIISHVTEGIKMAKKEGLPKEIINFIETHHGTTRVAYFYQKHLEANENGEAEENLFKYPGSKPKTKEETILMLADSIEAACKSLKSPTDKDISNLVDKIIEGKIAQGQLDDSIMTFKELEMTKGVFKQLLKSIHHVRIEYPKSEEE